MSAQLRTGLGFIVFAGGYVALIACFKWIDVYHAHFATTGLLVTFYNFLRLLFIFYLFWIIYGAGAVVLKIAGGPAWSGATTIERLALGFFTGAGLWHALLLMLGYLHLYTVPAAVTLTLPAVALSFTQFIEVLRELRPRLRCGACRGDSAVAAAILGLVVVFAVMLVMVKGLYPGGGSDYFSHYFYYYQTVIDRGDIWPNEVWYHYFESKGAGLFFLGMLLTDPLAPQLVTSCFIGAAAIVLYLLNRDAAPRTPWPLIGVGLFLAIYLHTPISGQFEKQHEVNAALVVGVCWILARGLGCSSAVNCRLWLMAAACTIIGGVVNIHTTAFFFGAVMALLGFWMAIRGEPRRAAFCIGLGAVSGLALAVMFAISYLSSGLMNDRPVYLMWRLADIEKLNNWGALPMLVKLIWGWVGMANESLSLLQSIGLAIYSLRLEALYPLVLGGIVVAIAAIRARPGIGKSDGLAHAPYQALVLAAMALATIAIAVTAGRVEPVSFYRHSSYAVPIVIAAGVLLWSWPVADASGCFARIARHRGAPATVFAVTLLTILIAPPPTRSRAIDFFARVRFFDTVLPNAWYFFTGAYSIDAAYTLQVGSPGQPSTAIYPGSRGAYAAVGRGTPIWSMHTTSFCMLPDCRIESVDSFSLGAAWVDVMFGSPEHGRSALQASGHNYFLFSRELPLDDHLPLGPLFAPDNIDRYLGIRWTDGTTTLLTWNGPGIARLDENWVSTYRQAVQSSGAVQSFPYKDMQDIFAKLNATPHPWQSFELPWHPTNASMPWRLFMD